MKTLFIFIFVALISTMQVGEMKKGYATWYDESWVDNKMASGLMFDPLRMEAAHRTLEFGTVVRVSRAKKNDDGTLDYRSTEVVVTDRGPCAQVNTTAPLSHKGCPEPPDGKAINQSRIIDLTPMAAEAIGMVTVLPGHKPNSKRLNVKEHYGVAKIEIRIIKKGTCKSHNSCKKNPFKRGELMPERTAEVE